MYSLKLELKLNNQERSKLAGRAGLAGFAYNFGLSVFAASWGFGAIAVGDSQRPVAIEKVLIDRVKTNAGCNWMKKYPRAIYSPALRNLVPVVRRWSNSNSGFPQSKSQKKGDNFTVLKKSGIDLAKGLRVVPFSNRQALVPGKKIAIPGLEELRLDRPIPFICSSQISTICRTAGRGLVSFVLDVQKVPPAIGQKESVGIALGVKHLAALSDGSKIVAPPGLKQAKTKLTKQQRRNRHKLAGNCKQGIQASNNAKKYPSKIGVARAKIANIRKDFLQKTTTFISRKYYRIRIENLNISGMTASGKLAEAVSILGLYEFRRMLADKEAFSGTLVELVDRWYPSSKICLSCGNIQPMSLSERVYCCQGRELVRARDENASINLEKAPSDRVRRATAELTPADKKESAPLAETGSKRQNKRVK